MSQLYVMCTFSGAFVHARLADNVEINNPMYLAGEDEPEGAHTVRHYVAHAAYWPVPTLYIITYENST